MATKPKTQIGTMACLCCGETIPVKTAENGTINAACPWCDFPAYAKAGTEAHRIIKGKVKLKAEPAPEPAPATKPVPKPTPAPANKTAPVPAPAPRARSSIFDIGA